MTPTQLELAACSSPLLSVRGGGGSGQLDFGSLLHGECHSARIGVRQAMQQQHCQHRSATPMAA